MNKIFGIIGMVCFAVAVGLGYFVSFPYDTLVEIALAIFGATLLIIGAVNKSKEAGTFSWKTIVCIVLACLAGVFCAIAGTTKDIFSTIATAVIALVTIIFGVLFVNKKEDKKATV